MAPLILLYLWRKGSGDGVIRAALSAAAVFAGLTVFACEIFSLFFLYTFTTLICFWLGVSLLLVLFFRKPILACLRQARTLCLPRLAWQEWVCIGVVALFLTGAFIVAVAYPPTMNYDGLTYHMPRVFMWMKNASVHSFATRDRRMLYTGPFAEYCILQMQVLGRGSDRFANLVQWCGYVGSVLSVFGIAFQLGAKRPYCFAVAVLVATVPLAILQAHTVQTDLFVVFWCLVVVYFVVWYIRNRPQGLQGVLWAVFTGLAGGAAVLTKNTAYMVLAPFAALVVVFMLRKKTWKRFTTHVVLVLAGVLLLNSGFFIRNAVDLNGDFLASDPTGKGNKTYSAVDFRYRISTLLMNSAQSFATDSLFLSDLMDSWVHRLTGAIGIDIDSTNPEERIVAANYVFTTYSAYPNSHDTAGSPVHALIVLAGGIWLLVLYLFRKVTDRLLLGYMLACCCVWLIMGLSIKWTPSMARYMLPVLVLPMAGMAFVFQGGSFRRMMAAVVLAACVCASSPYLLFDMYQPLVRNNRLAEDLEMPYSQRHFGSTSRAELRVYRLYLDDTSSYTALYDAAVLHGVDSIGVSQIPPSYPFLYLFRESKYDVRFINTTLHEENESPAFQPDAVLRRVSVSGFEGKGGEDYTITYNEAEYRLVEYAMSTSLDSVYMLLLRE